MRARWSRSLAALVALTLVAACGDDDSSTSSGADGVEIGGSVTARGPEPWPAPAADQVARLADEAGVALQTHETLQHHVHAHLDVFIDGEARMVPSGLGIVITDPAVRRFDELTGTVYGGIDPPCEQPCISPLHTHDVSGVIHTESPVQEDHTLGQLFTLWDVRLDGTCVGELCTPGTPISVYVDGDEVPLADAADVVLTDRKEIAIVIGDPPDRIPSEGNFSAA